MTRYVRGEGKETYVWTISIESTAGTFLATTPTETGVVVTAFLICYCKRVARGIRSETGSVNELCEDIWNNSNEKKKEAKKLLIRGKWRGTDFVHDSVCWRYAKISERRALLIWPSAHPFHEKLNRNGIFWRMSQRRRVRTLLQNVLLLFLVSSNFMGNWLSQKLRERKGKGAQLITAGTRFQEPMNGSRRIFSTLKGLRLN